MLLLFFAGLFILQRIIKEAESNSDNLGEYINKSNLNLILGKLNRYTVYIDNAEYLTTQTNIEDENILRICEKQISKDSTVKSLLIRPIQKIDLTLPPLDVIKIGNVPYLSINIPSNRPNKKKYTVKMLINLTKLHNEIALEKNIKGAYITISTANRKTIYHPEEHRIATHNSDISKRNFGDKYNLLSSKEKNVYSNFLGLKVDRYTIPTPLAHSQIFISINVVRFELVDFTEKIRKNIWLLIVMPLVLFISFLMWGIKIWQGETQKRRNAEQKMLNLKLINEIQSTQMIASDLEILKSGINPHFLFNSLGSLKALIKKHPEQAVEFTQLLSNQYRYLLDTEKKTSVILREELEFTKHYINIQKIRFKDSITIDLAIEEQWMDKFVPPLSVQTLVENSIKHNSASTSNPLRISITCKDGYVTIENTLNKRSSVVESTGKGQINLIRRYSYLTERPCIFKIVDGKYLASIPLLQK